MDKSGDHMKMNFECFHIQQRRKRRWEKQCHLSSFHVPILSLFFAIFLQTSARNIGILKQFTICFWKVSSHTFKKWYCILCCGLLFRRYQGLNSNNSIKFLLSQHLFWYLNRQYLMNGSSDPYKTYHFLKKYSKNFKSHICKLLSQT